MNRAPVPRPTDAELAILRILWDRGPSTVRQVHDVLALERAGMDAVLVEADQLVGLVVVLVGFQFTLRR